jgi:formamidopyrimidine-DNA glycosylase
MPQKILAGRATDPQLRGDLVQVKVDQVILSRAPSRVLAEAIAAGGSTLRDFAQADGALGYFQHRFRTYDREGEPCCNKDGGVIARKVQAGRSTFYCPVCQK